MFTCRPQERALIKLITRFWSPIGLSKRFRKPNDITKVVIQENYNSFQKMKHYGARLEEKNQWEVIDGKDGYNSV